MKSQTRVLATFMLSAAIGCATTLHNTTGLANPAETITFSEHTFSQNTLITNQFADLGVTFSPGMFYDRQTNFPNIVGDDVGNFNANESVIQNDFSIFFATPQTSVAFALVASNASVKFIALLAGTPIDALTSNIGSSSDVDFWGFTGETFDQISVNISDRGDGQLALIDNVQLGTAATAPEPGTFALVSIALLAAGTVARRRHLG